MTIAHVSYGQRHGWTLIRIAGELDLSGVAAVRERLHGTIWEGCRRLVVDLSGLEFCDSTGFAVLIAARRHMSARDGEIRLVLPAPGTKVRDILTVFGTRRLFPVYESAALAVADGTVSGSRNERTAPVGPARRHPPRGGAGPLGTVPPQHRPGHADRHPNT